MPNQPASGELGRETGVDKGAVPVCVNDLDGPRPDQADESPDDAQGPVYASQPSALEDMALNASCGQVPGP